MHMLDTDRDGYRVQPREDVRRKDLIERHAHETVPEVPQRLRRADLLPVEALKGLDRGQRTPVYGLHMPDSNRSHDPRDAIAKKTDGDDGQDDGGGANGHIVEEVLRGKDLYAGSSVRC